MQLGQYFASFSVCAASGAEQEWQLEVGASVEVELALALPSAEYELVWGSESSEEREPLGVDKVTSWPASNEGFDAIRMEDGSRFQGRRGTASRDVPSRPKVDASMLFELARK